MLVQVLFYKSHFESLKFSNSLFQKPLDVLAHIIYFLDTQFFNLFLKKTSLYTATSGFKIKANISNLETKISKHLDKAVKYLPPFPLFSFFPYESQLFFFRVSFHHIRDAAGILSLPKNLAADSEITGSLNPQQVLHILKSFKNDEMDPEKPPQKVFEQLEQKAKRDKDLPLELDPMQINQFSLEKVV